MDRERADRLKRALRENLKRRKAAAKPPPAQPEPRPGDPEPPERSG